MRSRSLALTLGVLGVEHSTKLLWCFGVNDVFDDNSADLTSLAHDVT